MIPSTLSLSNYMSCPFFSVVSPSSLMHLVLFNNWLCIFYDFFVKNSTFFIKSDNDFWSKLPPNNPSLLLLLLFEVDSSNFLSSIACCWIFFKSSTSLYKLLICFLASYISLMRFCNDFSCSCDCWLRLWRMSWFKLSFFDKFLSSCWLLLLPELTFSNCFLRFYISYLASFMSLSKILMSFVLSCVDV